MMLGWGALARRALALALVGVAAAGLFGLTPNAFRVRAPGTGEGEYAYHAEWKAFLAPEARCPGSEDGDSPVAAQERTRLCLLNWARERRGLRRLRGETMLMRSSALKAADIVRCDRFAHAPCGVAADAHVRAVGFEGAFGENIA
jgi:hypothetical protein